MTTSTKQRQRAGAITGAGSGLGRDIALGLAGKGYQVFGTAMTVNEVGDLLVLYSGHVGSAAMKIYSQRGNSYPPRRR